MRQRSEKKLMLRSGLVPCPIPLAVLPVELTNCPSWCADVIWAAGKTSWLGRLAASWLGVHSSPSAIHGSSYVTAPYKHKIDLESSLNI